jgi:hypothetical protein
MVKVRYSCPCAYLIKHHHEDVLGGGSMAPLVLTSALDGGEWSDSPPDRFIPRGNAPQYPLNRRLGESQSRSGRCRGNKNLIPPWESNPRRRSPYPVAQIICWWLPLFSMWLYVILPGLHLYAKNSIFQCSFPQFQIHCFSAGLTETVVMINESENMIR